MKSATSKSKQQNDKIVARATVASFPTSGPISARQLATGNSRTGNTITVWHKTEPVTLGFDSMTSGNALLGFDGLNGSVALTVLNGRFLSTESTCSFTGCVIGLLVMTRTVSFNEVGY